MLEANLRIARSKWAEASAGHGPEGPEKRPKSVEGLLEERLWSKLPGTEGHFTL